MKNFWLKMSQGIDIPVLNFDETEKIFFAAKDVFLKNWPKEYMDLID